MGYREVILADNPVAYWRLSDSGATAVDATGHGHDGVIHGGVTRGVQGALLNDRDTAMTFDGVNGFIDGAPLGTYNAWTCEAWFKPNGSQSGSPAILTDIYPPAVGYALVFAGGALDVQGGFYDVGNGGWHYTPFNTLADQIWSHIIATYNGTSLILYVSGVPIGTTTIVDAGLSSGTGFRIGRRWDNPDYIKGSIDEVAFYGYALTPAQAASHYAARWAAALPTVGIGWVPVRTAGFSWGTVYTVGASRQVLRQVGGQWMEI